MHILFYILFKSFFQIKTQEKDNTIQTAIQRILKHKKSSNFQKYFKLCENGQIHIIFKFISNTKLLVVMAGLLWTMALHLYCINNITCHLYYIYECLQCAEPCN